MNQYFATCPRGLEALLANEIKVAGAKEFKPTDGGVSFAGDQPVLRSQLTLTHGNAHSNAGWAGQIRN